MTDPAPAGLGQPVTGRLEALDREDVVDRIWDRDHTVWGADPGDITDRLGWLSLPEAMQAEVADLHAFSQGCRTDGFEHVLLMGMGGSSLAPEVLGRSFGAREGMLGLTVLDTTHPDEILATERALDLDRTLFVVGSKSGTTVETLAHLAFFWERVPDGDRFVAVTDPGSALEALAGTRGFRRVFRHPPDVGGRYAALSHVGLLPAALLGADVEGMLERAATMAEACRGLSSGGTNPGAWLGAFLGEAARGGRDKLTLVFDDGLESLGAWIEQLVAESTGKEGRGIVPIEGEAVGDPTVYGPDRVFVSVGRDVARSRLAPLEAAAYPVAHLSMERAVELGAEFFRWEFATAIAGAVLGINPFDQPDVERAKVATGRILEDGDVPQEKPGDPRAMLQEIRPGDYLSIQAYMPRTGEIESRLHAVRMRLRDRLRVATTVGFGPRFLHSTGQLHKGGPATGVFMQVADPPASDAPIPGQPYSFATLIAAQAAGDLAALRALGRRVGRVRLEDLEDA